MTCQKLFSPAEKLKLASNRQKKLLGFFMGLNVGKRTVPLLSEQFVAKDRTLR